MITLRRSAASCDSLSAVADVHAPSTRRVTLSARGIRVSFAGHEVLAGVDLDLGAGEWLGIIGPNGAGKSTLLRSIAGLVAHRGSVEIDGQPLRRRDIALVPQSPVMPDGMTVVEYVLLGRTAHLGWLDRESCSDRQVVTSVIRRLDLEPFAERPVTQLSGGEAQRVVIARALAQQAPILLLDEPTSALDLGHQVSVLELVDDLRRADGLAVIAAMHDLSTAARFSDRLALVDGGRLAGTGSPAEVLDPDRLSAVYRTPLTVRVIDGEVVVLPAARSIRPVPSPSPGASSSPGAMP